MTQALNHKKVAILVADGFEQVELTGPKQALDEAGAQTHIISPNSDTVQGWNHFRQGRPLLCGCHSRQRQSSRL